jgi:methionine-rich copper-binding protein CopC
MKVRELLIFGAASILGAIVVGVSAASAHSFPESESPAAGETINAPPSQVTIKYDAPIEKLFASLEVLDNAGQNKAAGPADVSPDGWKLSVNLDKLKPGDYTVKWHVVCIDSHRTEGSYSFTVAGSGQ